ncbi:hypothetical protein Tco_0427384 [Tanacetum coccineum]
MKNRTTLNLRHQLHEQNPEEGAETGIPEAHRHKITTQSVSKDLRGTYPLRALRRPPQPRSRKEGGVFNRLGRKEPATSARPDRRQQKGTPSRTTSQYSESEDSEGGHWKSKPRRQKSNTYEDDLSQPWTCEERNPFTPRIRHFSLPRTRMPSHSYQKRRSDSYEDRRTALGKTIFKKQSTIKDPGRDTSTSSKETGESTEDFNGNDIRQKSCDRRRSSGVMR